MQRSVLERWIDGLTEREFDQPLLRLLRAHGFYDICFTHGQYEFGKDFIAKRVEDDEVVQYGVQSKAGNVSGGAWDAIHGQVEELTSTWLTHPNYDATLPLKHVLLVTGRLKGKAIQSSKQYQKRLRARGEGEFTTWERERLLDLLEGVSPKFTLEQPQAAVERLIARVSAEHVSIQALIESLEVAFPAVASVAQFQIESLQLSCLTNLLWSEGRLFHAVTCSQHAVRLAAALVLQHPADVNARVELADAITAAIGLGLGAAEQTAALEPIDLAHVSAESLGFYAAYPLACISTAQCLALAVLHEHAQGNTDLAADLAARLATFVDVQPGCMHPLSDRHATSLMTILTCLSAFGHTDSATRLFKGSAKWTADRIEFGFGLSHPRMSLSDEVLRTFGSAFDFISLEPRNESLVAMALLDTSWSLRPDLYPVLLNEFLAVGAVVSGVVPGDTPRSIFYASKGATAVINLTYPTVPNEEPPEHFAIQPSPRQIETECGWVVMFVCAALCGDRLYGDAIPRVVKALTPTT